MVIVMLWMNKVLHQLSWWKITPMNTGQNHLTGEGFVPSTVGMDHLGLETGLKSPM